ncbi:MAG TPA: hypothetical protein DCW42_00030 [Bacteroidetes bacterium]|nr:hypothetical protein [Bacteroidota bacterium]
MATYEEIMIELERLYNPEAARGMARFGICLNNTFGISTPNLSRIAKNIGKDHLLAQNLWGSGIHEARILAAFLVTENQMIGIKILQKCVFNNKLNFQSFFIISIY